MERRRLAPAVDRQPRTPRHAAHGALHRESGRAVSPDLRQAITCSDEGIIKVWNFETGSEIRTVGQYLTSGVPAATPYGSRAISGTADGSMIVWAPFEQMRTSRCAAGAHRTDHGSRHHA